LHVKNVFRVANVTKVYRIKHDAEFGYRVFM
jgi:hypothetical protein